MQTLREWVIQEAEFQIVAHEAIHGIADVNLKKGNQRTHLTTGNKWLCKICRGEHGVRKCNMFKNLDIKGRWIAAKREKLCYRCLGSDHLVTECQRWHIYNIRGCKEKHSRLLHKDEENKTDGSAGTTLSIVQQGQHRGSMEGESGEVNQQRTMVTNPDEEYISLTTVPVVLKNGEKSVVVNALLDDGSTQRYLNSDVAAEVGLEVGLM